VTALALYALAGFLLVPALVKWQLVKQLPSLTHRQTAVRQVKFNPFALSLAVRGLALTETNQQPFASFEEFYANFQLSSLFRWAWTFDEIRLTEPRANLILGPDGRFNFANLLASTNPPAPTQPEKPPSVPGVLIFSLVVTNGQIGLADLTRKTPFRTTYTPINLKLDRFTTRRDRESPYSFAASSDSGRSLTWEGTVTVQPLGSSGSFSLQGFQFPKHSPYLEDFTRAELTEGTLDVAAGYRFALATNGMDLVVSNLAVTVSNLVLKDPETGEAVVTVPSYELGKGSLDWRNREVRVRSLVVNEPQVLVRRRPDGTINLPSLVLKRITSAQPQTNAAPGAPWVFSLDDYRVQNATVQFEDAQVAGPFRTTLKPLALRVEQFTTRTNSDANFLAELTTEAGETAKLAATYSVNPARGKGTLTLTGVDLKKYQPYLAPLFRGQIASGQADLSLDLAHALRGATQAATVSNLVFRVDGLEVKSPDRTEKVLTLPSFAVESASGSWLDQAIQIGAIKSSGATIQVRRDRDGTINLLSLLASTNTPAATTNTPPTSAPGKTHDWRVGVAELALRDYAIRLEDRQTSEAAAMDIDQLGLSLRGAAFPSNAPVQVEFSARVNGAGLVSTRGTVLPYTPQADLEIGVTNLLLSAFQPWIDQHLRLSLTNGSLGSQGRFRFGPPEGNGPRLHFAGGVTVTNLGTSDRVLHEELVRWNELAVAGIDLGLQPTQVGVQHLRLSGLRVNAILGPDQTLNLLTVLPAAETNAAPPTPNAPASPAGLPLRLDEFKLDQAAFRLEDRSIQPPCVFEVKRLDGTVTGLSSQAEARAAVDFSGHTDEASPFGIRGTVNPLARDLTLNLAFTNANLQLAPFSTYLEKYAGHPLNRGRLSLDLAYTIQQQQLQASNLVRVEQLMLGPRNESPDASKLPVKLAVALLKDRNGRIELDVPVSGRLDDPEFKVLPIVLKVIVNLIVKAAASPFKLLGALVGGGEELSFVEFVPGESILREGETNKLEQLVKALEDRPAINLEIAGSIDPVADRDAIARAMVQEQVKSRRCEELQSINQAPAEPATFQPDPADQERLLRAMVTEVFGTNLTEAVQALAQRVATNAAPAAAHPPSRRPGFLSPVTSLFKPSQERAALKQARRQAKADTLLLKQNPQLAALTTSELEVLLATRTEVPPERLRQLMEVRSVVVQDHFLSTGKVTAERLFLVPPKTPDAAFKGEARVNLSLN